MVQDWEKIYSESKNFAKHPYDLVISVINRLYPAYIHNKTVLDLGCGMGNHLDFLRQKGFSVYGIDGSATAVEYLHRNYPNISCAWFLNMPYEQESFDLILDHHSIYDNEPDEIEKIIGNCYKILKSKGKIISFMYNSGPAKTVSSEFEMSQLFQDFNYIELAYHSCRGLKYIPNYSEYIYIGEKA